MRVVNRSSSSADLAVLSHTVSKADSRQSLQTKGLDMTGKLGVRDGRGGGKVNLEHICVPDRHGRERFWGI